MSARKPMGRKIKPMFLPSHHMTIIEIPAWNASDDEVGRLFHSSIKDARLLNYWLSSSGNRHYAYCRYEAKNDMDFMSEMVEDCG